MGDAKRIAAAALAVSLLLAAGGCCCGGHSRGSTHGTRRDVPATSPAGVPTLGRQLEDLRAAYERGAISGDDYEIARGRLVEQGGRAPGLERR